MPWGVQNMVAWLGAHDKMTLGYLGGVRTR